MPPALKDNSQSDPFTDPAALRALLASPADPASEPASNFPLGYYEHFLQEIRRLDIEVITFRDLFADSDDWDYRANYPREFKHWHKHIRDPKRIYLLIQHDVDNHPSFTKRMAAMEALYGVRSNIFLFRDRYSHVKKNPEYDVDHAFFQHAQKHRFVIGYHQNALPLAGFDMQRAIERFRSDVAWLRTLYDIEFMVPHGGVGGVIDGKMRHNFDVPIPPDLEGPGGGLRWVFNRHGPEFASHWSDGGLAKTRDPKRIAGFDIVGGFLHTLRPGTRSFCLVHPQRWGYNVDMNANPLLAQQPWYRQMCSRFAPQADKIKA